MKHLETNEFVDLMDGLDLPRDRSGHLEGCGQCRSTLAGMNELQRDISTFDEDLPDIDWTRLRSSVRDRLLARAVQRSSFFQRWTGQTLRPAMAWSLAFAVLIGIGTLGTLRHYQTEHPEAGLVRGAASNEPANTTDPVSGTADLFVIDDETIEAEVLAWSQTELFSELDGLETSETELLRELIFSAAEEDLDFGFDQGTPEGTRE